MSLLRSCALLSLLVSFALPAHAAKLNAAASPTPFPIAPGFDPALLHGTTHFGVYFNGTTVLGTMQVVVTPAPGGSGTWAVDTTVGMEIGPSSFTMSEHAVLDSAFAAVSTEMIDLEISEGVETARNTEELRLAGGKWKRTRSGTDGDGKSTLPVEAPNYGEMSNMVVLVRALELRPATYNLQGVFHENDDGGDRLYHAPVTMVVEPQMPFEFRGKMVPAHLVRVDQDGELTVFAVSPEHRVLALWPESEDVPLRMVSGTLDECSRDMAAPGSMDPDVLAARAVVEQLVWVMAAQGKPESLDQIMDWAAFHQRAASEDPAVATQTVDAFADHMKQELGGGEAPLTEAEAAIFCKMLDVQVTGDEARVFIPGFEEASFLLHRRNGQWLMYWVVE
jgi:hypothetical protein